MASKWDKELASDICAWIKRATGATVPSEDPADFAEALNDGQTLCKYCLIFRFRIYLVINVPYYLWSISYWEG